MPEIGTTPPDGPNPREPAPTPDPSVGGASRPSSKRRRRGLKRWLAGALFVLALAWLVLTHSRVTRWLVIPRIEKLVDARIDGGEVTIQIDGTVRITDASLRTPGLDGPAGAVLDVKRLKARPNWRRLLGIGRSSDPIVQEVELTEPTVRISQSADDSSLNLNALKLPAPQGGEGAVPDLIVRRGIIELGEHRRQPDGTHQYTPLKRLDLNGTLKPAANIEKGVYEVVLTQIAGTPDPVTGQITDAPTSLIDVRGTVGRGGVSMSLKGLSLDDWPASSVPTPMRDIFRFMDLQGRIRQTDFDYDEPGGVRASIDLEDVAVNLPVNATDDPLEGPVAPAPPMRMKRVNGWIKLDRAGLKADLHGQLEDLPYHVRVDYQGITVDAPFICDFECENFQIQEKPQILRFAPATVKYRLATFSNPTAIVTARARVTRATPVEGLPGPVRVEGTLEFHDGVAAYERFPYQFRNLRGTVRFDERTLDIISVEGASPGGARITARAHVSPLTDDAQVDVEVHAFDVPIDRTLEEAMGPSRRRMVVEIASEEQYARLIDAGILATPDEAADTQRELAALKTELASASLARAEELRPRLAHLEALAAKPTFALRGKGDVSLKILRQEGWESIWSELIEVRLGTIGVLPDRFPLPVIAENVKVIIDGENVTVEGGSYRGLTGGTATVSGRMRYPTYDNPTLDPLPKIHIEADSIPVDDRLIAAVGGAVERARRQNAPPTPAGQSWVEGVLHGLGLRGTLNASGDIASSEEGTALTIETRTEGMTSTPTGVPPGEPLVEQIAGTVRVNEFEIATDLTGLVGSGERSGRVRVQAMSALTDPDAAFVGPPAPTRWAAIIDAPAFSTEIPVEPILTLFSPAGAQRVAELRTATHPEGRADLAVVISGGGMAGTHGTVDASRFDALSLDLWQGRLNVTDSQGIARLITGDDGDRTVVGIEFEGFRAPAVFNAEPVGQIALDGRIADLERGPRGAGVLGGSAEFTLGLIGARFESALVDHFVRSTASPNVRAFVAKSKPAGEFDLWATPRRDPDGTWGARGTLSPHSLAVTLDGGRATFETLTGEVEFDGPASGTFRDVAGESAGEGSPWSFRADGSWIVQDSGTLSVRAELSGESSGLPPSLLAVIPPDVTTVFNELSLTVRDRVALTDGLLRIDDTGAPDGKAVRFDGTLHVAGISLEAGVPITDAFGTLDFQADTPVGGKPKYEIWGLLDRFRVSDVSMTDGRVRVVGDAGEGQVLVPLVSADCYGGRLAGSMRVDPAPSGRRSFESTLSFSGVRFAPVLRDLGASKDDPPEAGVDPDRDASRGIMDAHISLGGTVGNPATRRGRGSVTIGGGSVVRLPLVLPLVQVSNLQLPTDERLSFATGDFYIQGPTVVFEDLSVFSESVQIYGYGTVAWPDMDLNMRFNSRSLKRVPILSSLLEAVRDQFIGTSVTGTVKDPHTSTVPLAGASEMLTRIFGTSNDQERLMADIERRAARDRERARTTGARQAGAARASDDQR